MGWSNARIARAERAVARADWRAAFRGYIVGAQLLQLALENDEAGQELKDSCRRRMAELLDVAETLKQHQPGLLLLVPSRPEEVAWGRAWAEVDASESDAAAVRAERALPARLRSSGRQRCPAPCYIVFLWP
jgi:hypothetical protein